MRVKRSLRRKQLLSQENNDVLLEGCFTVPFEASKMPPSVPEAQKTADKGTKTMGNKRA